MVGPSVTILYLSSTPSNGRGTRKVLREDEEDLVLGRACIIYLVSWARRKIMDAVEGSKSGLAWTKASSRSCSLVLRRASKI